MRSLIFLAVNFTLFIRAISAQKYVFAHVVVGDTAAHTQATWASDIALAKAAAIDAFMLDIAYGDSNVPIQVGNAFAAAEAASFKLAFSFDYLGGTGPWPASGSDSVVSYLNQYVSSSAYLFYSGAAFVSTFEGTSNIGDWAQGGTIRSAVSSSIYFVPDYTSLGPSGISPYLNDIEGAFSWNIWPEGATNMTDAQDMQWVDALSPSGKTYMMGVSPWFFHSASGGTEWVWRGDDMWADRWEQTFQVNPQFVEIVTWNDYGESHYIGPLHDSSEIPTGSAIYDTNNPHDSWRDFLPYYIATYKGNSFNIAHDQMQYWYHTSPVAGGSTCGVVGNNPSYQPEVSPNTIVEDAVFFSALLTSAATVTVQIGNGPINSYAGTAGHNHWSLAFGGQTGVPVFCVVRGGVTVQCSSNAAPITATTTLSNGCTNYNAWVGSWQNDGTSTGSGPTSSSSSSPTHTTTATTPTQTSGQVCIAGTGPGNYVGLCSFCCNYGYCPGSGGTAGPCTCTAYGSPVPTPPVTGTDGVPLPGEDSSYLGLCSFACDHGYCPSTACEVA